MNEEIDYNSRENKLAVFTAWLDGKPWQLRYANKSTGWEEPEGCMQPMFQGGFIYRVKPTPKRVPLEAKDVPPVCWVRRYDIPNFLIVCVFKNGVSFHDSLNKYSKSWKELMEYEYSTDRVNWQPCSKESK